MDNAVSVMDPPENGADSNRFGMELVTAVHWGGAIELSGKNRSLAGPEYFSKKLQKSREIFDFTAFSWWTWRDLNP